MRTLLQLEASDARSILEAAQRAALTNADAQGPARVSIAVVDAGGQLLAFERRDGASPASAETAIAKARMAALTAKATESQEQAINGARPALAQLAGLFGQPAAAMAGGIPLVLEGQCLGAVGVSGMTPNVDVAIAQAAAAALQDLRP